MGRRPPRDKLGIMFESLHSQMVARLTASRATIEHPGAKGAAAELEWTSMLREYLPRRYTAEKAFVIDSDGRTSDEIDIVVFDRQYSPFMFRVDGAQYVPAEGVYAALEVKQVLSAGSLRYASRKVESVRKLKRTSIEIVTATGRIPPKEPARILGGLVALGGRLTKSTRITLEQLDNEGMLNLGCAVGPGLLFHAEGVQSFGDSRPPRTIAVTQHNAVLASFLLRLLHELQSIGTVPAIDLLKYEARTRQG